MKQFIIASIFMSMSCANMLVAAQVSTLSKSSLIRTDIAQRADLATHTLRRICQNNEYIRPGFLGQLIYEGARVNDRNELGFTPFFYAVLHGNVAFTRVLLRSKKVDLGMTYGSERDSIMHVAATSTDNPVIVRELCRAGAAMHAINNDGQNAAHYATQSAHFAVANLLIERGADLTQRDYRNKRPYDDIADLSIHEQPGERFQRKIYNRMREQEKALRE